MSDNVPKSSLPSEVDEISFLDLWRVLWNRRYVICGLCIIVVLVAMVFTINRPKHFEATTSLLPARESGFRPDFWRLRTESPGTEVLMAMLKSRVMVDEVVKQYNLIERYQVSTIDEANHVLKSRTTIKKTKENVLSIMVKDSEAQMASDIANFYALNLDRINRTFNVKKISQDREFLEKRLQGNLQEIAKAENALVAFQTKNNIMVDPRFPAMILTAAGIQGQITAQEVQIRMLDRDLSPDDPALVRAQSILKGLQRQLSILESGEKDQGLLSSIEGRLNPALVLPNLALEYGRILRQLIVQETLHILLTSQYEQAKLAEARDTPTFQVLDFATPPSNPKQPSLILAMLLSGVAALFIGIFLAFFLEYLKKKSDQ